MSDLDLLREIAQQLRQPAFEAILDTRRRRTRRTRIASLSAAAVAVVLVAGTWAATDNATRTDPPPIAPSTPTPSPTPSPTQVVKTPGGQQTLVPDLGPGDVHGYEVLATVTSSQPDHVGASELTATVPDTREAVSTYCRAEPDLYYVLDIGDGGGASGRCSPDADTTLAPGVDIGDVVTVDPVGDPQTVRMWIARPSAAFLDCQRDGGPDCPFSDLVPVASSDAEFGFQVYAHESTVAFQLLDDAGNGEPWPLEALATRDGTGWLVDRAVVAAPGADRLVFDLPAAGSGYLVDVYTGLAPHFEQCRSEHVDELADQVSTDHNVYEAALDRVCGTDVRLVVDDTEVAPDKDPLAGGHFQELGAELAPGTGHEVLVEVVRGDPRDLQYAVVVRTRTPMP